MRFSSLSTTFLRWTHVFIKSQTHVNQWLKNNCAQVIERHDKKMYQEMRFGFFGNIFIFCCYEASERLPKCSCHPLGSISTWNALSLQWNTQPRDSMYLKICWGNNGLNDVWSFTFVKPPHVNRAAARPFGVNPAKWRIVMFRRRLLWVTDNRPTSVTEQYDKFICSRLWENLASRYIALSLMLKHFLTSSTMSCLHPMAMADRPTAETQVHPRISSTFRLEHFDKDVNEESVILLL